MATDRKRYIFNRGTNGATASAYLGLPIFSTPTATIGDVCIRSGSIIGLAVTLWVYSWVVFMYYLFSKNYQW